MFPKYKTAIFVNGCFWHMHGCKEFVLPKSNLDYWIPKFERNKARDEANIAKLKEIGWNVIVLWECEIKDDFPAAVTRFFIETFPQKAIITLFFC